MRAAVGGAQLPASDARTRPVCHAFPDDAYITDQFFVALIGVAVALPVDMFLQRAFEARHALIALICGRRCAAVQPF